MTSRTQFMARWASILLAVPALALSACGDEEKTAAVAEEKPAAPTTRTYKGPTGTVTLPAEPKTVVSLDAATTNILVALDRPPAGAFLGGDEFDPLLKGKTDGIVPVGRAEIDVERVATVKPDMMVGFDYIKDDKSFDKLQGLGPVASYKYYPQIWQKWTKDVAKLVNAPETATRVVEEYDAAVAETKPSIEGKSVTIIEPMSEGKVWWYGKPSGGGQMITDLGGEVQPIPEGTALFDVPEVLGEISQERVGELTGDTLIVFTRSIGPEKAKELLGKPIFKEVKAVKSGNVKYVDGQAWVDLGPLNWRTVMDDIKTSLAG